MTYMQRIARSVNGASYDISHSNRKNIPAKSLSKDHSIEVAHFQTNRAHSQRTKFAVPSRHDSNELNEGSGQEQLKYDDNGPLSSLPHYDEESESESREMNGYDYDIILSAESGSGQGQDEDSSFKHGKVNLPEIPSNVIDAMNIHWFKKSKQIPPIYIERHVNREAQNHYIPHGPIRERKLIKTNMIRHPDAGRFPKDRGKISVSNKGIHQQLLQHSTSEVSRYVTWQYSSGSRSKRSNSGLLTQTELTRMGQLDIEVAC